MSSGRVIVRACWGGTCAMDGWNRRAPAVLRGDGRYGAITVGSHTRVRH